MKPCRPFKKRIALSIAGGRTDAVIQDHLAQCAACRAYAEEISALCAEHAGRAAHLPSSEAPLRLHGKIRASLDCAPPRWGWLRPVAAGALAALAFGLYLQWRPSANPRAGLVEPSSPPPVTEPSYAAYRNHLSRSAEELESALSRQETGVGVPGELFTVSTRAATPQ